MQKTALGVAGVLFFIIGVLHLVRLATRVEILVGGVRAPLWASLIGGIVFLILAVWMFWSSRKS